MDTLKKILITAILVISTMFVNAQTILTLEEAMNVALENSPDIKQSRISHYF